MNSERSKILYCLSAIAVIVAAVYCRAPLNGFVSDDLFYLVGKEVYKRFDLAAIFTSMANGIEYLPVRDLTLAVDYALWGESPFGLHLTNLLLFIITCWSVFFLCREIVLISEKDEQLNRSAIFVPLGVALLYAAHPIQGEAVNWISGRNVILAGLFSYTAAWAYLRHLNDGEKIDKYYVSSLVFFILALFSKATPIILPACLLILKFQFGRRRDLTSYLRLLPHFIVSGAFFILLTRVALSAKLVHRDLIAIGLDAKLARALQIPYFYLGKLFWPQGFSTHYDAHMHFPQTLFAFGSVAALSGIAVLIVLAVVMRNRAPVASAGVGWFFVSLVPILNLYSTYPVVSDRYAFIPAFGVFVVVLSIVALICRKMPQIIGYLVIAPFILITAWFSYSRVEVWKDNKSLWQATIKAAPNLVDGYIGLGAVYFKEGKYEEALQLMAKAQSIEPKRLAYDLGLATLLNIRGRTDEAIDVIQKALSINPDSYKAHFFLGDVYAKQGDYDKALYHFNRVLTSPEEGSELYEIVKNRMAAIQQKPGATDIKTDELSKLADKALSLDKSGKYAEALECRLRMEKLGESRWELLFNIAFEYEKLGQTTEASRYYRKVIEKKPDQRDALNNLGLIQMNSGDFKGAAESFRRAMEADRNFAYAPFNLAMTYKQMGDKDNAKRYFTYTMKNFPELKEKVAVIMQGMDK